MQMTQAPQGAPGEGDPAAGGPEGGAAPDPDAQGGPALDEGQEAPPEGDTGDEEEQGGDDQGPAPQADSAALAKQMVGIMAGQFGRAMPGDSFGSVIPAIWRLEG